jgi:hypothetical protein
VFLSQEAWAQDAAKHGLGVRLPSSAGEHVAGAGAGATAARPANRYKGGSMHEENDRAAICAITRSYPAKHPTKTQIVNKARTKPVDYHFRTLSKN